MVFSVLYVSVLVAANLLVAKLGPQWSPLLAFLFIGPDLTLRDKLHDELGVRSVLGLMALAGLVSFALNPASYKIAVASLTAFVIAGVGDTLVYQWLRARHPLLKMNASNAVGAVLDSVVFLLVAFGPAALAYAPLQVLAKLLGGGAWSVLLARRA